MARRVMSSASRSEQERLPDSIGQYPLGVETGLPLIMCDLCGHQRVVELVVQTDENGNRGRVFFKCPRNIRGVPGRCTFYEWQRGYLTKLVKTRKVVFCLEDGGNEDEEAESKNEKDGSRELMAKKMDELISALRWLYVVIAFGVLLGVGYLFK